MIKYINEIGNVLFVKSKKASKIIITIKNDKTIRVSVPIFISYYDSECFLLSKSKWIHKQILKLSKIQRVSNQIKPDEYKLQKFKIYIRKRIMIFSEIHNLKFKNLNFKWMRSRWGSCSQINNISLNYWIYFLPIELQDYILLHELVHIKVKNHSKLFWFELDNICKNSNSLKQRLKNNFSI